MKCKWEINDFMRKFAPLFLFWIISCVLTYFNIFYCWECWCFSSSWSNRLFVDFTRFPIHRVNFGLCCVDWDSGVSLQVPDWWLGEAIRKPYDIKSSKMRNNYGRPSRFIAPYRLYFNQSSSNLSHILLYIYIIYSQGLSPSWLTTMFLGIFSEQMSFYRKWSKILRMAQKKW